MSLGTERKEYAEYGKRVEHHIESTAVVSLSLG